MSDTLRSVVHQSVNDVGFETGYHKNFEVFGLDILYLLVVAKNRFLLDPAHQQFEVVESVQKMLLIRV